MRNFGIVLMMVAASAGARVAAAEPRSWTAVKNRLPADMQGIGTIDVAGGRDLAGRMLTSLLSEDKDVAKVFATIASSCKLEPAKAIDDVTILGARHGSAVAVIALHGLDEGKLVACANQVLATVAPTVVIPTKSGAITHYGVKEAPGAGVGAVWLGKDVVAILLGDHHANEKSMLDEVAAAKTGASGPIAKFVTAAPAAGAVAWGATLIDDSHMVGAWGRATLAKGKLAFDIHAFAKTPEDGITQSEDVRHGIADMQKSITTKSKQPERRARLDAIAAVLRGAGVANKKEEITITLTADEQTAPDALLGLLSM